MKPQPTRHAIGDDVADLGRGHEPVEGAVTDAEVGGKLLPGQSPSALLALEGGLQGTRRKTAREIVHWTSLLGMCVGEEGVKAPAGPKGGPVVEIVDGATGGGAAKVRPRRVEGLLIC
jgi:hypothetical protein